MIIEKTEEDILCEISNFRYLSNINSLPLLDATYLECFITFLLKNKNYICFEGIADLQELVPAFQMRTVDGVKRALNRLYDLKALTLYKKVGKHHEHKYIFSINTDYTKYFYKK